MPPLVDESGNMVFCLASAEMVKIAADGKELWRARIQGGGPAAAPVRLSGGTIAVISTGGFFVGVSDRGKVVFTTPLGARGPDLGAAPVPTVDGGASVVAGRTLIAFDSSGRIQTETILAGHASSTPIVGPDGMLVAIDDGTVVKVKPPRQPQRVGSFSTMVEGGIVMADDRTLLAAARDRLLALDLKTGLVSVRATTGSYASVDGPVTVLPDRTVLFTTTEGFLIGLDRAGQETLRATVERTVAPPPTPQPGFGTYSPYGQPPPYPTVSRPNPPLVADGLGHVAFVRSMGRLGVVSYSLESPGLPASSLPTPPVATADPSAPAAPSSPRSGSPAPAGDPLRVSVSILSEKVCVTPVVIVPAGKNRLAVVCREGLVAVFGE